jgi:hypothetical protein
MKTMLTGSIDLSKIDKTKVISKDKDGNPFKNGAKYLNVVVWINEEVDQYGNIASVQISQSKEERESGAKATYIGNLKNAQGQSIKTETPFANVPESKITKDEEDDLPF